MAQLIKTTGETSEVKSKNGSDFSLEELKSHVGDFIEIINLQDGRLAVFDEEGKLKGCEINDKATEICKKRLFSNDYIVGNVLICNDSEIK